MRMLKVVPKVGLGIVTVVFVFHGTARGQTCNLGNGAYCATIQNTNATGNGLSVSASTGGIAISASSAGYHSIEARSVGSDAIQGISSTGTGGNHGAGVYGETTATYPAAGVVGYSTASGGSALGVYGKATSNGVGVEGDSSTGNGVVGWATGSSGTGVYGTVSGTGYGIKGSVNNVNAYGIYGANSVTGGYAGYFSGDLGVTGTPRANQSGFTLFSDLRLKKNVRGLTGALDRVLNLHGVTFEWQEPKEHGNQVGPQFGFIAQEVEKVMPAWVSSDQNGLKSIGIPGRAFEAMLVESIRTLKEENEQLKVRIEALETSRRTLGEGPEHFKLGLAGLISIGGLGFLLSKRRPTIGNSNINTDQS